MKMYAILRRDGWRTPADLEEAAERSRNVLATELVDDILPATETIFVRPDPLPAPA